jgi:murein DD-endopeptidase MepM/ murein hydrolase activator NlpD
MPTDPTLYTVRRGDTLGRIAARFGTSVDALVAMNAEAHPSLRTDPGRILPGWNLRVATGSRHNDHVLFVGMNSGSTQEIRALRQAGARVVAVQDSLAGDDKLVAAGVVHDLSTAEGALAFTRTLGLRPGQTTEIARVLVECPHDARDELGRVAEAWAPAEKGGSAPSRLVLSGHSVGTGVWGDNNGMLTLDALSDLGSAMPEAARGVEDVHIAGCYSGGEYAILRLRAIFPRLKTAWAYADSAPGAASGATIHLALWERATRGESTDLDREVAERTRRGDSVVVWTVDKGYQGGQAPAPIAETRAGLAYLEPVFAQHMRGEVAVDNPQTGPLRDYYDALQMLLQHPELPAEERPALEARRDRTIRLLYYANTVARRFSQHHGDAIRRGYAALGLPTPNLGSMSRAEALGEVERFSARVQAERTPPQEAQVLAALLHSGLVELDPAVIPEGWV